MLNRSVLNRSILLLLLLVVGLFMVVLRLVLHWSLRVLGVVARVDELMLVFETWFCWVVAFHLKSFGQGASIV